MTTLLRVEKRKRSSKPFRILPRELMIAFDEDSPYHGAEIWCTSHVNIEEALMVSEVFGHFGDAEYQGDTRAALAFFGDHAIKEWNLEDEDGNEIVPSAETLREQPFDFALHIIRTWTSNVLSASRPLSQESNDGALPEKDQSLSN